MRIAGGPRSAGLHRHHPPRRPGHAAWIFPRGSRLRRELDELFVRENVPLPDNNVECSTIPPVREVPTQTDSVAPLPLLVAARDPALAILDVALESGPRAIGLTYTIDPPPSANTTRLIELLIAVGEEVAREHGLRWRLNRRTPVTS